MAFSYSSRGRVWFVYDCGNKILSLSLKVTKSLFGMSVSLQFSSTEDLLSCLIIERPVLKTNLERNRTYETLSDLTDIYYDN